MVIIRRPVRAPAPLASLQPIIMIVLNVIVLVVVVVVVVIVFDNDHNQAPSQSSSPPSLTPAKVDDSPLNLSKVFFLCPVLIMFIIMIMNALMYTFFLC